jgi:hypothetical protein
MSIPRDELVNLNVTLADSVTGTIHSYGAGVQSRALLHMALEGALPRPDRVVFADTQAEPEAVYAAVTEDKEHAERAGIPFDIITNGDLSATDAWGGVFIPAHTLNPSTGSKGMLRRQCTGRFKVDPIRRHLRSLGYKRATLWLGISTDEVTRVKPSTVKWITNAYPLIELGLNRDNCEAFLRERGIAAVKSACVFCPYRSEYGWAKVKANESDWMKAVEYDRALRHKRPVGGELFVHPDRVPLDQASVPDLNAMRALFDADGFENECEGYCGV